MLKKWSYEMLLAVDIGNSSIVLGVFQGNELYTRISLDSVASRSGDQFAHEVLNRLGESGVRPNELQQVIISSVVPRLGAMTVELSRQYLEREPIIVSAGLTSGLSFAVDDPRKLGADRIVNAVAAKHFYGVPHIVVDFGTATTFNLVDSSSVFCGGLITPGLRICAEALTMQTALLPKVELVQPKVILGKSTEEAMAAGLYYGYAGLVEGILARIGSVFGSMPVVIATGGLAAFIAGECGTINHVFPELTLQGLRLLAEANSQGNEQ
jgi:type III pantothenate kinase